jgi:serine/threonine protein kinase
MGLENTTIGNYHVLSTIAYGSFGRVYLARHNVLTRRMVALKLMHTIPLSSPEEHEQFLNEAKILELLQHPFILPILDVGIHDGIPYIVSEYAEGGSLRQYLKERREQPCELEEALIILSQVGLGLQYAHQQNIIHRDIKPENILFNGKGEALLADFGLATMLATASVKYVTSAGTPRYMAPEQFQGQISKETDQYALGCMAYELLTGHAPFDGTDPIALLYQHIQVMPTSLTQYNPQLSPSIDQAVLKALSKQRQDRYADVETFIAALSPSTVPLALATQSTRVAMSSIMQEATEVSSPPNPPGATLLHVEIAEGNISVVERTPSEDYAQAGEELQSTTLASTKQPAISTIEADDHQTLPVQRKRTLIGRTGLLSSFMSKPTGRMYTVAAMVLILVFITSSLLWAWQSAHSAITITSLQSSKTAISTIPTLTVIVSPTVAPTSKAVPTAKPTSTPVPETATSLPSIVTSVPATPTSVRATPTSILPTPTSIPSTPTPVPLKLAASPSNLSSVSSQCPGSAGSYTCTVTLSTSSGSQGNIQWSSSNTVQWCRGTCQPGSVITISPSSGTLNAGSTVQISISTQSCSYPGALNGSVIFSGPANTVTISYNCYTGPS